MELATQIEQLTNVLPSLPYSKLGFASSLINQFSRSGRLSPKQAPWVTTLIALATGKAPAAPAAVGNFSGVIGLFKTAAAKLKHPRIRLQVNGTTVVLSVAGPRSSAPGSVNVAGDGPFTTRAWYGRVSPDGRFDASRTLSPQFAAALVPVLEELATETVAAVQRYGSLTGACTFCALPLTDARSKAAGCGETCAKHFGLHEHWKTAATSGPLPVTAVL